jgi:hypothetical protein
VAATKAKADDIKTWPVSEVDKKGKKKKGTLGVGNGAVFFASESDKVGVSSTLLSALRLLTTPLDTCEKMANGPYPGYQY